MWWRKMEEVVVRVLFLTQQINLICRKMWTVDSIDLPMVDKWLGMVLADTKSISIHPAL
jgi:hypothetical protein